MKSQSNHPCPYCAQAETVKDGFGYCLHHDCFGQSGLRSQLVALMNRASNLIFLPTSGGQVGSVVTNPYSPRNRRANDIMWDATKLFGHVPYDVLKFIDPIDRLPWDRNVRW